MAFFDSLTERQPGQPRKPEVPGAPPTVSRPADKVNPPAVASGPPGRPSLPPPTFPGGATRPLPVQPATSAPSRPAPGTSTRPQTAQPKQPAPVGPELPGLQSLQHVSDHIPTQSELLDIPPGVKVLTPYGEVDPASGKLTLSPEGEMKYKEAIVQRRKKFGPHPFAGDPNAPQPQVRLNGRMFNPFSGQWVE